MPSSLEATNENPAFGRRNLESELDGVDRAARTSVRHETQNMERLF